MLEKLPDAIGHALRDQRAGLDHTAYQSIPLRAGQGAIEVTSLAFIDHAPIPAIYTDDGDGRSPPLQWLGVPAGAQSVVILVEDGDSPTPHPLVHAIAVDLAPLDAALPEGALNHDKSGDGLQLGRNSFLQTGWLPPDPPSGHGVHRYAFQVFALDTKNQLSGTPGRDAVLKLLAEHAIASGCLIGTYERHDTSVKSDGAVPSSLAADQTTLPFDPA